MPFFIYDRASSKSLADDEMFIFTTESTGFYTVFKLGSEALASPSFE